MEILRSYGTSLGKEYWERNSVLLGETSTFETLFVPHISPTYLTGNGPYAFCRVSFLYIPEENDPYRKPPIGREFSRLWMPLRNRPLHRRSDWPSGRASAATPASSSSSRVVLSRVACCTCTCMCTSATYIMCKSTTEKGGHAKLSDGDNSEK